VPILPPRPRLPTSELQRQFDRKVAELDQQVWLNLDDGRRIRRANADRESTVEAAVTYCRSALKGVVLGHWTVTDALDASDQAIVWIVNRYLPHRNDMEYAKSHIEDDERWKKLQQEILKLTEPPDPAFDLHEKFGLNELLGKLQKYMPVSRTSLSTYLAIKKGKPVKGKVSPKLKAAIDAAMRMVALEPDAADESAT